MDKGQVPFKMVYRKEKFALISITCWITCLTAENHVLLSHQALMMSEGYDTLYMLVALWEKYYSCKNDRCSVLELTFLQHNPTMDSHSQERIRERGNHANQQAGTSLILPRAAYIALFLFVTHERQSTCGEKGG